MVSLVELKWTERKPEQAGLYLRSSRGLNKRNVIMEQVTEFDGDLYLVMTAQGGRGFMPLRDVTAGCYWYGPIPEVPDGSAPLVTV